jgi:tripartite ATP-independent transporter DctM subunit
MLVAFALGIPIAVSIGLAALLSNMPLGIDNTLFLLMNQAWGTSISFSLSALPLFVFMGEIISRSKLIARVFNAFIELTKGKVPGGLLQPVILTATVFAACSGSTTASAAALSSIAYPELKARNYPPALSTGTLASAGTLAMLIPPSVFIIIYGAIAGTSVSSLYLAAVIPGLLLAFLFSCYVGFALRRPHEVVVGRNRLLAALELVPYVGIFLCVMAPLYLGIATATEVAAVGSAGAMLLALAYRRLSLKIIWGAAVGAARINAMIFFILFSGLVFSNALASTGGIKYITDLMVAVPGRFAGVLVCTGAYLVMGMFFDTLSIQVLTTPIVVPVMASMGFSPVWTGIFMVLACETSLITPPVGLNLFVLAGSTKESVGTISRGAWPFVVLICVVIVIIYLYPPLVEWLPYSVGK